MKLIILTTATPREEVHNKACIDIVKKISSILIDNDIEILWFVNIDNPLDDDSDSCKRNFINSFSNYKNINVFVHINKEEYCFGKSGARLYFASSFHAEESSIFFWLEDDWALEEYEQNFLNDKILHFISNCKVSILKFMKKNRTLRGCGNPILFKKNVYDAILNRCKKEFLNNSHFEDSEDRFRNVLKNMIKNSELNAKENILFEKMIFFDIGRQWRYDKGISKWKGRSKKNKTWSKY